MNYLGKASHGVPTSRYITKDTLRRCRKQLVIRREISLRSTELRGELSSITHPSAAAVDRGQECDIHEALKQISSSQHAQQGSAFIGNRHQETYEFLSDLSSRRIEVRKKLQEHRASEREVDKLFLDLLHVRSFEEILTTWTAWKDFIREGTEGARLEKTRIAVLVAWVCTEMPHDLRASIEALNKLFRPLRPPKSGDTFQDLVNSQTLSIEERKMVLRITAQSEEVDLRPNSEEFIHGIDNLISKFRANALEAIYLRARRHATPLDSRSLHRFAEGFLRIGRPESSRKVLEDMQREKVLIEPSLWNALLQHAGKMRNTGDIANIWSSTVKSCVPDTVLYTSLIDALFSCAQVDTALQAFQTMSEHPKSLPNSVTCNTVVKGLVNNNRAVAAWDFVKDTAEPAGMKTDTTTYNLLLRAFLRDGNTEKAHKIGSILRTEKLRDVATYAILLDYYAAQGPVYEDFISKVKSISRQMASEQVKPNAHLYSTMMKAILFPSTLSSGSKSNIPPDIRARSQAQEWLDDMRSNSIARTVLIYELILRAHFANYDSRAAFATWRAMRRDQIAPDSGAYFTMISGLIEAQMLPAAVQLYHNSIASGLKRETISINLLNAAVRTNNKALAQELLNTIQQNSNDTESKSMMTAMRTASDHFGLQLT